MNAKQNPQQKESQTAGLGWGSPAQIWKQLGVGLVIILVWSMLLVVLNAPQKAALGPSITSGEMLTWENHVYPIIQRHCALCHGSSGGLNLSAYEQALAGGNHGPAIIPGDAGNSLLYKVLLGPVDNIPAMPLGQAQLPEQSLDIIRDWINQLGKGEW